MVSDRLPDVLRKCRQDRGWSLDQLAAQCGVSRASLSRIENASVSPTAEVLGALAAAFDTTASRLLALAEEGSATYLPYADQSEQEDPDTGLARRFVSPPANGFSVEIQECHLPPGSRVDQTAGDGSREHHLVLLDGAMAITVDNETLDLTAGDCLRLHLSGTLMLQTGSDRGARFMLVRA